VASVGAGHLPSFHLGGPTAEKGFQSSHLVSPSFQSGIEWSGE
jgi:hypothetical protein